jgi:CheY-like chemotaxis protein/signal transduction histidine kinase
MRPPNQERVGLYALTALLMTGVFALDANTYVGLAIWPLYFVPLIVTLYSSRPLAPVVVAFAATALIALGYVVSPAPPAAELVHASQLNRSVASFVLIALGFVCRQFVSSKVRLALQDWANAGHARLQSELRGEQEIGQLANKALSFIAEYIGAPVGSVYVASNGSALARMAGYGLASRNDGSRDAVGLGQTLVGQAAADGRVLIVRDVPEGYADVSSGVGRASPRELVLAPTTADDVVNGVLELGFFSLMQTETQKFLETIAPSLGVALRSAQYRQRQAELLEETQRQAEELQAQQEELRASNEELEEQSNTLKHSQAELEESNAKLEEQARVLETQKERLASAQDVLQRKAAEVERASRYKSEFLANMSHELRTPLNSSLILAKLLVDNKQGNLTPEQVEYAKNIYTAGNDLLTLINDILDLSKIEAGKLDLNLEPVDVTRLFDAAKQRFEPLVREKKLELSVALAPDVPLQFESDQIRLQQVISNLLSNAVKFTDSGSVRLLAESANGDMRISVSDTGIGIPAHQHDVIFEAFRQADGTTNRKYGGTGLGLSISRELVALMGGTIELESEAGQGSTFTVVLPLRTGPKLAFASHPAPRTSAKPVGTAHHPLPSVEDDRAAITEPSRVVLVVEDDPVFASILRDLARELRFQCVIARSADEGLELARQVKPAAMVLDIGLPDHSGLTVLELLKRDASARHIPIHVVSVHDYQRVAREMGAVGYALKPIKREQLAAAFQSIEQRQARKARSVLVVEDDQVQRDAIANLLSIDGVTITSVADGNDAWEKLGTETFDCIVLDLMLPGSSGFDLLRRMAATESTNVPPVIIYTARALTQDEEQRLRQHARSIIIKGARSPERLLEEVTLFLHQVAADLPEDKRQMLRAALDREAVFVGRRILLVEDDVRNIFALTSALQPKGADIEIARNGVEALRRLAAHPPIDLVLMDIMMPEMDGLVATREIRKRPAWTHLPIIALTAKAMPDDRRECLEAGANDYIAKPISVDKLVSLCRVWMPR